MSRRPVDKAAQNTQVIKNLLRMETNKTCADCKKNKHPRWASWNLGVFVCIRCSGIHRGMGTHISRVKSVDLDSWTDEQLQSIMKWGNARANRYWEHKLAPGHVPSDAKIENFIRTKYESRRWVMDGPIPDPSTLGGDGDEDVPLSTVQARAGLDRSASQRTASGPPRPTQPVVRQAQPAFDLMGDPISVPQRASTTEPTAAARPPPPQSQPQQSGNLLGGLNDFLSGPPGRPTSTGSGPGGMSRPDLKQSILSLYASKPAVPSAASQEQAHQRQVSLTGGSQGSGSLGGLNDAFGGLNFGGSGPSAPAAPPKTQTPVAQQPSFAAAPKAQAANPDAYAALTGVLSSPQSSATSPPVTSPPLTGGGFFDAGSKPPAKPSAPVAKSNPAPPLTTQATDDWGDFSMADSTPAPALRASQQPAANKNAGLLDFTAGGASSFAPPPAATKTVSSMDSSVFNLSSKPAQKPQTASASNGLSGFPSDPWGGSNEWATPDPAPAPAPVSAPKQPAMSPKPVAASGNFGWDAPTDWGSSTPAATTVKSSAFDTGGWGEPTPTATTASGGFGGGFGASAVPRVQPEEDFGGWGAPEPAPAPPRPAPMQESAPKPASTSEDLFGNVWG